MTNISGFVTDVGLVGSHGRLIVQAVEFYGDGEEVVVPSPVSFPIAAGVVSANVSPGAARLTIHVGSSRRDWFVNVPESDIGLGDLIETFTEYEPPVVSAAIAARDAAVRARDEAVAAVKSDRVAAESAAGAAASSASAADVSAGDASAAAGAAARSASGAAGSASAAASSAAAASGSATSAAGSATDAAGAVTDARAARDAAEGHATSAAGSASAAASSATAADGHADRAEAAANEFDLTATSSTLAPGSQATVTVSGDGPAYSLAFGVPQGEKGDKGDQGEISQAQLDAAVASLVDNAPEALDTLTELAAALGNDPNFATTVSTQIGERAKTSDVNAALAGKADVGAEDTATWDGVTGKPATFPPSAHKHPVTDLDATGTRSASTYLRGDGSWATPPDTTYSVPTQEEAEAGTATTARAFSAQRVAQASIAASGKKDWQGTQAQYDALGTKDADRTYWIV